MIIESLWPSIKDNGGREGIAANEHASHSSTIKALQY